MRYWLQKSTIIWQTRSAKAWLKQKVHGRSKGVKVEEKHEIRQGCLRNQAWGCPASQVAHKEETLPEAAGSDPGLDNKFMPMLDRLKANVFQGL